MSLRSLWIGALTAAAVFGAVTTANSALIIVSPEDAVIGGADTAIVNFGNDIVAADVDKSNSGAFSDVFFLTNSTGDDTFLNFLINTTFSNGQLTGIANLEFAFSNGDIFSGITDANGVLSPVPFALTTAFDVGTLTLTVTGDPFGAIPSYDFQASVVPLPPALLLFGTALGGMGWLSRRRKESATA